MQQTPPIYPPRKHSHHWDEVIGDLLKNLNPTELFLRIDGAFVRTPTPVAGSIVGNIDGGEPDSNYGGITPIDGGGV